MSRLNLSTVIFALLLIMCGAVGTVLLTKEPVLKGGDSGEATVAGHGVPHPRIAGMQIGGDGLARYRPIRTAAWVFALSAVSFFSTLLILASRPKTATRVPLARVLLMGCGIHLLAMAGMIVLYESYLAAEEPVLTVGFPKPSAWMLFVLWPAPLVFVLLYYFGFDHWVFRADDQVAFEEIMKRHGMNDPSSANHDSQDSVIETGPVGEQHSSGEQHSIREPGRVSDAGQGEPE